MLRGIYTSASGMLVEQARQDVITNNLANVDTTGFKKDLAIFRDEPSMDMHRIDDNRKIFGKKLELDFRPYIGRMGTGASIDEITTIHEQGILQTTNNKTDLALIGDGMFAVESPNGIKYTRAGNFRVGAEGFLVDANGNKVMALKEPAIMNKESIITNPDGEFALNASYVPLDGAEDFKVDLDGKIYVNGESAYRLMIVNFDDPRHLKKIGYNYYEPADERVGFGRFGENTKIEQGMLEKSNVNIVREMVNMITVMRAYESNQKAIATHDGTLGTLISKVGAR
ncbi:MAG: flagellar hook-basal body protein [Candidatus Muirbacterium halophilum]|nr:flagellar hook-basal body protein [Candidatus Muirbacterium halophilum]MCK9475712.1 flagellar hook-basal body protein [Candidatus Muirbacterium halophilum]